MIGDLETDEFGPVAEAEVCVLGAGPAGISLALELAEKNRNVILLESGGESYDVRTQGLYDGHNIGREYYNLTYDRVRYLGGTSHHWGGWCVPLRPEDLQERSWVPHSGWPITWGELNKFYGRAQTWCELDRLDYDPRAWLEPDFPLLELDGARLENYLYKWSPADNWRPPTHFGRVYRDRLAAAQNLRTVLHANIVDIECNEGVKHVTTVVARTLDGKELRVSARYFVLATGGLENPRLLLAANKQASAGLGNDQDLVGRYFMEHIEGVVAHILIDDPRRSRWLASYEKRIMPNEHLSISAALRPTFAAQRKKEILNAGLVLRSRVDGNSGYVSAKRIATALAGDGESDYVRDLGNVLTGLDEVALWIHHRRKGTNYEFPRTRDPAKVWVNSEQAPNPESRVALTDQADQLGIPQLSLDWRIGEFEKRTLREASKILAEEIARIKGMRVQLQEWLLAEDSDLPTNEIFGGHHHMGTTRMAQGSSTGVVDPNCRVFGLDNLYIAGSSVFPTVGYANPTLTIVALSVRLADHLDGVMETPA